MSITRTGESYRVFGTASQHSNGLLFDTNNTAKLVAVLNHTRYHGRSHNIVTQWRLYANYISGVVSELTLVTESARKHTPFV